MEAAIASVTDEAERIKCDIAEMRNATSHNLAASDQQITQLQVLEYGACKTKMFRY